MSRVTTITGPLAALVAHAGGVAGLAAELGVSEATIWRWGARGMRPGAIVQRAVNEWAARRKLPPPF